MKRVASAPLLVFSKLLVFFMIFAAGNDASANEETLKDIRKKDLLTWFNKHEGKRRLVLFFSPTWSVCVDGARWVQKNVLSKDGARDVEVLAIWLPVLATDTKISAEKSKRVLLGKKITVYWDKGRTLSKWFHKNGLAPVPKQRERRLFRHGFLWDCYLLYDRKAKWGKIAPKPIIVDGAVMLKKQPLMNSLGLATKESSKKSEKKARLY